MASTAGGWVAVIWIGEGSVAVARAVGNWVAVAWITGGWVAVAWITGGWVGVACTAVGCEAVAVVFEPHAVSVIPKVSNMTGIIRTLVFRISNLSILKGIMIKRALERVSVFRGRG